MGGWDLCVAACRGRTVDDGATKTRTYTGEEQQERRIQALERMQFSK